MAASRTFRRSRPSPSRRRGRGSLGNTWRRLPRPLRWLLLLVAFGTAVLEGRETEALRPVAEPFDRALYAHWTDADGDCRDTRQDILARDSQTPVRWDVRGCAVAAGSWRDPYTGDVLADPRGLDVDHLVPLKEAHRSGADRWPADRRAAFANDPANLLAVSASANRSKGDGDPLAWLPPAWSVRCVYVERFVGLKAQWGLEQDPLERLFTDAVTAVCARL